MTREDIIAELRPYFEVRELVCDHIYARWGEASWQFLDTALLHTLLVLRTEVLKRPLICNTSTAHQRGMRCNMCDIVRGKNRAYLSAHVLGKALDLTVEGMTAEQARTVIKKQFYNLPYPVRIEGGVSWLHIDVLPQWGIDRQVYEFKA